MPPVALTLDLDDTLWPIAPVMERAERALDDWLREHCPEVAAAYPIERMRALREAVYAQHPELAHDYTATRLIALRQAMAPFGHGEAEVQRAFEVFYAARNRVELYPEARAALDRLAARFPLVSISNGNASLERIGLERYFVATLNAREHGVPKPSACIFHAACRTLRVRPEQVLHVGDHPEHDVLGALEAGLGAAWINRDGMPWPHPRDPHFIVADLGELAARLLDSSR